MSRIELVSNERGKGMRYGKVLFSAAINDMKLFNSIESLYKAKNFKTHTQFKLGLPIEELCNENV